MSAAIFENDGAARSLDGVAGPAIVVTEQDVTDPKHLARMLQDVRRALADLTRRWQFRPQFFVDQVVDATGTTKYQFQHNLRAGRVFWWPVEWSPSVAGTEVRLSEHADSDADTLVLVSGAVGTVTICIAGEG